MASRNQKRRSNARVTPEAVLDAAAGRFAEQGYRGTNLDDVASGLGVTRQALYYYYNTKHDILEALFERLWDRIDSALEQAVTEERDPALRFEAMFRSHVIAIASQPELAGIFAREDVSLEPDVADAILQRRRAYHGRFTEAYREGVAAGAFRNVPASVAVSLLLGAANWMFRWYRVTGMLDAEQIADHTIDFFRDGYRADRSE